MRKKINSEVSFLDDKFKIKIGTTDKKMPETIYIQFGTYITPLLKKNTYNDDIINFEKSIKKFIKDQLYTSNICSDKNFISVVDIANDRITVNKKSYLEIQIFLKTKLTNNKTFKSITKDIHKEYVIDVVNNFKEKLVNSGFSLSKTKK